MKTYCSGNNSGINPNYNYSTNMGCNDMKNNDIGMAYVPVQMWNQVYDLQTGLKVGTIFPDLNKPYTGRRECV